jgi:pantoate kinase
MFAETVGFTTDRVLKLMDEVEKAGAVGAAQNMLGEAVHALVERDKVKSVLKAFKKFLPRTKIFVAEVCPHGVQLAT